MLTAGSILARLPERPALADVLAAEVEILSLPRREREALRAALARHMGVEDFVAAVEQVFDPSSDAATTGLGAAPATCAELVALVLDGARARGWRPDGRPIPRVCLVGGAAMLVGLPRDQAARAAGILAGLADVDSDHVLRLAVGRHG